MKIYEAYEMAIKLGMSEDPRPEREIREIFEAARREYDSAGDSEKELFDPERLWNPYEDCRFSCGSEEARDMDAETFMWGIDIGTGEVLLADRLREKGRRIDALVGHHPLGSSRVLFPKVMSMQADMYHSAGVPINVAEGIMGPRTDEALRNMMGVNHNQAVDAARLLGIPLFNIHSAADNMVQAYLTRLFESREPRTLGDIVDVLMGEPEYRIAARSNARPKIMVGRKDSRCGRILCKMTGGTSGPKSMYEALSRAGIGTVVGMHFPDSHYDAAREANVNLVVSGHMPSDSLGINLICDRWADHGISVIPCSGFIRCERRSRESVQGEVSGYRHVAAVDREASLDSGYRTHFLRRQVDRALAEVPEPGGAGVRQRGIPRDHRCEGAFPQGDGVADPPRRRAYREHRAFGLERRRQQRKALVPGIEEHPHRGIAEHRDVAVVVQDHVPASFRRKGFRNVSVHGAGHCSHGPHIRRLRRGAHPPHHDTVVGRGGIRLVREAEERIGVYLRFYLRSGLCYQGFDPAEESLLHSGVDAGLPHDDPSMLYVHAPSIRRSV